MLKRLIRAYRHHDIKDVPGLICKNVRHLWERRNEPKSRSEFDLAGQVETDDIRETGSLDINSPNVKHAVRYEPSPVGEVKSALARLDLEWPRFTFIDFGSGKGRVLLLAAELPFKQIIGVEFSAELVEQAAKNIANYQGSADVGQRISCQCLDAVDFAFPPQPLVCYFYNPFGRPVMEKVLSNLLSVHAGFGHEVYIVYVNPVHRDLLDNAPEVFSPVFEAREVVAYRAQPSAT